MPDSFSFELKGWKELEAALKAAPQQFEAVVASILTDLGFRWRNVAVSHIASRYVMRSPRFILSRMFVEKARPGPIASQQATVGSTYVRGKSGKLTFDGFAAVAGKPIGETRARTFTLAARGGTIQGKAKPSARLTPGANIARPEDYSSIADTGSRVQAMIRMAAEGSAGKTFIIPKGSKMKPGLYRIKRKRGYVLPDGRSAPQIQILQRFDHKPTAKPWNWLLESMERTVHYAPIASMWQKAMDRIMKVR